MMLKDGEQQEIAETEGGEVTGQIRGHNMKL